MSNAKAVIMTIGDELLIGQTIDTNSAWIARHLNAMGIEVIRRIAVGDTWDAITGGLNEELPKAELLVITGGLGPTSDDITKPLLCEYFGGKLVRDQRVLDHLYEMFAKRNRPIIERNLKQADVPDNCTVLFNQMGTAPGMWFERDGKIIVSLPGVPFEMKHILETEVLTRLNGRFQSDAVVHRNIMTAGEGESFIAERLMSFEASLPAYIKLAYLPDASFVKLRLTGTGKENNELTTEVEHKQQELAAILGNIVIALDDVPMEQLLAEALKSNNATVAFAESCTGGYFGHTITSLSGASAFFTGSVVCYDNSIKEKVLGVKASTLAEYGAVSLQTVTEMAEGVRQLMNVDYALSVSGVLGPTGGTDRVKVGTVWMAVSSAKETRTKEFRFFYDRERNKEMAVKNGLLFLWKFINGKL